MKNLRASVYTAFTFLSRVQGFAFDVRGSVTRFSSNLCQRGARPRSFALQRGSGAKNCHKDPLKCSPSPVAHDMQMLRRRTRIGESGYQDVSKQGEHSMSAFRFPFIRTAARVSVGLAALVTLNTAMAMDEYVVYGKRAPVIPEIDRAALRDDLEQRPAPVAADAIADSVRAALAVALRSDGSPREQRFASNDPPRPRG
jgi:hypothetical protein